MIIDAMSVQVSMFSSNMQANVVEDGCDVKQESAIGLEQTFEVGQDDLKKVKRESDEGVSTEEDLINICDTMLEIETVDVLTKLKPKNVKVPKSRPYIRRKGKAEVVALTASKTSKWWYARNA